MGESASVRRRSTKRSAVEQYRRYSHANAGYAQRAYANSLALGLLRERQPILNAYCFEEKTDLLYARKFDDAHGASKK